MKNESIVVVAWDFSNYAKATLRYALDNHQPRNLRVICVIERPNPYAFGYDWGPNAEEDARARCTEEFLSNVPSAIESKLPFFVDFGEPAPQILQYANEQGAKQIIMSTHGRTGISRILVGSVAQKVLARAECPVVVLPSRCVDGIADASTEQTTTST